MGFAQDILECFYENILPNPTLNIQIENKE
jgi:hypothetical protein